MTNFAMMVLKKLFLRVKYSVGCIGINLYEESEGGQFLERNKKTTTSG